MSEAALSACACSRLLAQQLERWAAGDPVLVEQLLGGCPGAFSEPRCLRELIQAEILLRQACGQTPRRSEYLARFPTSGPTLSDLLVLDTETDITRNVDSPADPAGELRQLAERFGDSEHEVGVAWVPHPDEEPPPPGRSLREEPLPELNIPGYEVVRRLGHGGLSTAYLARQTSLQRQVVLKVLQGDPARADLQQVLCREAQAMAALNHPNIVQVHHLGDHGGRAYIVMEYLAGGSLADHLQACGTGAPVRAIAELVEQIATALGFVHRQGFVHRDIKPGNLLLTGPFPGRTLAEQIYGTAKIGDFGLSARYPCSTRPRNEAGVRVGPHTPPGAVLGTPIYMAPEQAAGNSQGVGPPADVYSLGVTLYELLTGRVPFRGATAIETFLQVAESVPAPIWQFRPETPRLLEAICNRCLARAPADRYANGDELAQALRAFLNPSDVPGGSASAISWWRRFFGKGEPGA